MEGRDHVTLQHPLPTVLRFGHMVTRTCNPVTPYNLFPSTERSAGSFAGK